MAERLVKHALEAEGAPLKGLVVQSAGISAGNGYPASSNSIAALKKVGIDLNDHSSKQTSESLLESADFIFGMTSSHLDSVNYYLGEDAEDKTFLMREFIEGTHDKEISDPFGGNFTEYENARDSMVEAIPGLIQFLKTKFPSTE